MRKPTKEESRRLMALTVALVALGMGGGATIGLAGNSPDAVAAQISGSASNQEPAAQAGHTVSLYKSPTCTCCAKWGDNLREAGFQVQEVISQDVPAVMEEYGVPMHLRSCHLGVVGGYVVVGHVPADLALQVLQDAPAVTGIAVTGMPIGSPGMDGFGRQDSYDVVAFGDEVEYVFESR